MINRTIQKPKIRNRIKYCRTVMRLQQKDLAFLMDLPAAQISKWELGERIPGVYNAIGLSVVMGVLVDEIFHDFRREWQERVRKRWDLLNRERKEKVDLSTGQAGKVINRPKILS